MTPRRYADPYLCGVGLGLVLLGAFALAGRGLGASGAFASGASALAGAVDPAGTAANPWFTSYRMSDWLVFEIIGVVIGGTLSAWLSGRLRIGIDRGPAVAARTRLGAAAAGGAIMGLGAVLARGCTSGQALTGGALLSVGSWLFMAALFVAGFAAAQLFRRLWQ